MLQLLIVVLRVEKGMVGFREVEGPCGGCLKVHGT